MKRILLLLLALTVLSIGGCRSGTPTEQPIAFSPGCRLPFENIEQKDLAIDKRCGKDGSVTADSSTAKQNELKNNFCATGPPVELSFTNFDQLQQGAVDRNIPFGNQNLPDDRSCSQTC